MAPGFLTLRFFYFTAQQQAGLARGARIRCFGEARRGPQGLAKSSIPEYRRIGTEAQVAPEDHLTPIYPLTEGVTQGRLRMVVGMALDQTGIGDVGRTGCRPRSWPTCTCLRCATPCSSLHRPSQGRSRRILLRRKRRASGAQRRLPARSRSCWRISCRSNYCDSAFRAIRAGLCNRTALSRQACWRRCRFD